MLADRCDNLDCSPYAAGDRGEGGGRLAVASHPGLSIGCDGPGNSHATAILPSAVLAATGDSGRRDRAARAGDESCCRAAGPGEKPHSLPHGQRDATPPTPLAKGGSRAVIYIFL